MRFAGWDRVAAFGCGSQLIPQPWDFAPPSPAPYGTLCNYAPAIGSWATCVTQVIDEHVPGRDHAKFLSGSVDWVNFVCEKAGGGAPYISSEDFWAAKRNATDYSQPVPSDPTNKIIFPVYLHDKQRRKTIDGVHAEFANLDNSNSAALWIYWYFAAFFLGTILCQTTRIKKLLLQNRIINQIRSRFIIPTLWLTKSHSNHSKWALGGLWPSSMESSIIVGLLLVHTISLCAWYSIDENEVSETTFEQFLQGLGNRSGILAFALMPLIVIFSMRCQILQESAGFKYTTMIALHRWLGRSMMIDAIIHSVAFYYHAKLVNEIGMVGRSWFWLTGVAATASACVMVVIATGAIRSRWYEIFSYTHIALAILFLYLCWQHVIMFGWTNWITASIVSWIFERLGRIYTIFKNGGGVQIATIAPVGADHMSIMIPHPKRWKSFPSHYAFVYFLHPKLFWQSHPFTVCDTGAGLKIVVSIKNGATKEIYELIRARNLPADSGDSVTVPVLLEGPYGHDARTSRFDKVLLFAGGSGIPGPLAIAEASINARSVIVVRNLDILSAYESQINSLDVPVDIYITRSNASDSTLQLPSNMHMGRPDVQGIIQDFVIDSEATSSAGAIICCGPPALNDEVRNTVAKSLEKFPDVSLEYIEEFQVW